MNCKMECPTIAEAQATHRPKRREKSNFPKFFAQKSRNFIGLLLFLRYYHYDAQTNEQ